MICRLLVLCSVLLITNHAHADYGDLSIGGQLGVGAISLQDDDDLSHSSRVNVLHVQPELNLRFGLMDWLHLDTGAGLGTHSSRVSGFLDLGLTATFDVFAIVPEIKLGMFWLWFDDEGEMRSMPGADVALALRYHVDFNWSIAVGAELNLAIVPRYQGTLSYLYVLQ